MNPNMEQSPHSQAERLFLAIGELDERLLVSVTQGQPEAARRLTLAMWLRAVSRVVAVALLCLATVLGGSRLIQLLHEGQSVEVPGASGQTIEKLLLENLPVMTAVKSEEALYFFSGTPSLICRFSENGDYYVYPLSGSYQLLDGSQGGQKLTPEESRNQDLRIWVCDGQGYVRSPQLSYTSGNASFGCLIDYLPELEPSDAVLNYLALQLA